MKNWTDAGKNWRCADCLAPLEYLELWQDAQDGEVYCQDCWLEMSLHQSLAGMSREMTVPALVCDECAAPMTSSITQMTTHHWEVGPQLCESCRMPSSEQEVEEALKGFMKVLEDTGEDG